MHKPFCIAFDEMQQTSSVMPMLPHVFLRDISEEQLIHLIQELGCEGDAKLGRDEGDAPLAIAALGIELFHSLESVLEIRSLIDQVPACLDLQSMQAISSQTAIWTV